MQTTCLVPFSPTSPPIGDSNVPTSCSPNSSTSSGKEEASIPTCHRPYLRRARRVVHPVARGRRKRRVKKSRAASGSRRRPGPGRSTRGTCDECRRRNYKIFFHSRIVINLHRFARRLQHMPVIPFTDDAATVTEARYGRSARKGSSRRRRRSNRRVRGRRSSRRVRSRRSSRRVRSRRSARRVRSRGSRRTRMYRGDDLEMLNRRIDSVIDAVYTNKNDDAIVRRQQPIMNLALTALCLVCYGDTQTQHFTPDMMRAVIAEHLNNTFFADSASTESVDSVNEALNVAYYVVENLPRTEQLALYNNSITPKDLYLVLLDDDKERFAQISENITNLIHEASAPIEVTPQTPAAIAIYEQSTGSLNAAVAAPSPPVASSSPPVASSSPGNGDGDDGNTVRRLSFMSSAGT